MRKSTRNAISNGIIFFCIFGVLARYGLYAVAVLAIFVTVRIMKNWGKD